MTLARAIRKQIILKRTLGINDANIYAWRWFAHGCFLDEQLKLELHDIARKAQENGELEQLGLVLDKTRNTSDKLSEISRLHVGTKGSTAHATINVYLLVIGKASIIDRETFLKDNPEYRKYYHN
jgi:hypothetical protein